MSEKRCECEVVGAVARDGKSTCMQCGGVDAYKSRKDDGFMESQAYIRDVTLIVYHGADMDGHLSAALLSRVFPNNICIPINYGEQVDVDEIRKMNKEISRIVITDLPFFGPIKDLEAGHIFPEVGKSTINCFKGIPILWFDHHETSRQVMEKHNVDVEGLFKTTQSATKNVHEYYTMNGKIPYNSEIVKMVELVNIYDCWLKDSPQWDMAQDFNKGIQFHTKMKLENLKEFIEKATWDVNKVDDAIVFGKVLKEAIEDRIPRLKAGGESIKINGHKIMCYNVINDKSYTADLLKDGNNIVILWSRHGKEFHNSIRTDGDVDVSKIAKYFEGGGHKKASGFSTTSPIYTYNGINFEDDVV